MLSTHAHDLRTHYSLTSSERDTRDTTLCKQFIFYASASTAPSVQVGCSIEGHDKSYWK